MDQKNLYPGRLLSHLRVKAITEAKEYLLTWEDSDGNSTNFHLAPGYADKKNMLKAGDIKVLEYVK